MNEMETAIHEAGHAVATLRNGVQLGFVSIQPNDIHAGVATHEELYRNREEAEIDALIACAGYAALIAAGYDKAAASAGCDDDFEAASQMIAGWGLDSIEGIKSQAVELLSRDENRQACPHAGQFADRAQKGFW